MHARTTRAWKNPTRTYAYVTSAGVAGGTVSTTPATAAAAPFNSYASARAALVTAGALSGGVIRFGPGTWVIPSGNEVLTAGAPLTLEPVNPADRATTILSPNGTSSVTKNIGGKVVIRDLTLLRVAGTSTLWRGSLTDANIRLVTERCTFRNDGTDQRQLWIRDIFRWWVIDCDSSGAWMDPFGVSGGGGKHVNVVGSTIGGSHCVMNRVASLGNFAADSTRAFVNATPAGAVYAFCRGSKTGTGAAVNAIGTFLNGSRRGIAIVGNLLVWTSGTGDMAGIFNDTGITRTPSNVVMQMNTSPVGGDAGRANFMYTATAGCEMRGQMRQCVWPRWATKTDVFDSDAAQTGGWPTAMHVGWRDNCMWEGGSATNAEVGPGSWRREAEERNLQFPAAAFSTAAMWDAADTTHYQPAAASVIGTVEAGWTCYSHDMLGRVVPGDGTARTGAIQRAG
jgi:hypothetical protein